MSELSRRGVKPKQVQEIAMDMSPSFIAAAGEHFPSASICFDRFHVMKLCGQAVDAVRMQVAAEVGGLPRGAVWALRGNVENLKAKQIELRGKICLEHAQIARSLPAVASEGWALAIKDFLAETWNYLSQADARGISKQSSVGAAARG